MVLQVKNGITITKNENGSITLNGTATEGFTVFSFSINLALKAGTYTHSITNMVNGIFLSFDNTNTTMISSNKTGTNPFKTFTLTEDTVFKKYHMWVDRGTTLNNLTIFPMLCGGTGTAYKSYIKPQLYVRNSNGVYEEFTKKQEEIYSTGEQAIGTWIDGKTIYKKTVIYTNTEIIGEKGKITEIYINHNISDFKQLCDLKCVTSDNYVPLVSIGSNNGTNIDYGTRVISVGSKQIGLRIINDTWGPRTWYFTLKYTKTTD